MLLQSRPPSKVEDTLRKAIRLVSEETGIIKILHEAPIAPDSPKIFGCGAMCRDFSQLGYPSENEVSGSTSLVRDHAIAGAVGEAVERYSAAFVPYENLLFYSPADVPTPAVSPRSLTLYDETQYARAAFEYKPLAEGAPIAWVTGYSLTHRRPVLVPAFAVYQPYRSQAGEPPMFQQITTGLACGNTLEEAILSGICEVVERDAAMLMWLQRREPAKIKADGLRSGPLSKLLGRFGEVDKNVTILDVTTDMKIPAYVSVWDGPIGDESGAIFASCAHLNPQRAVAGALNELAQCLLWATSLLENKHHLPDPANELISKIEEHVLWPLKAGNRSRYSFTLASESEATFEDLAGTIGADVLTSIEACVDRISERGLEVVAIDVTSPDIRECGFRVARTVIPGAQPLFFGTGMHRVSARALEGRSLDAINLHPHPFP